MSNGLSARGRKGGLAADHTSPLRRIVEVIGEGSVDSLRLRLECGHIVSPPNLGDFSHYISAQTPEVGKRRRCVECRDSTPGEP